MGLFRADDKPPYEVVWRRSARARRLSLRVSHLDGRVTLTLPKRVSERQGRAFLADKDDWIRAQLARCPAGEAPGIGGTLPFAGERLRIVAGAGRAVRRVGDRVEVPADRTAARLLGWVREQARARLTEAADRHAAALGRPYGRITLRDTRSRWGSCSSRGDLMFSWRLVMAPPRVLDYVAAHEVAHLAHMDHSPRFWACVESLFGDCRAERRWLREHGAALHAVRFVD